MNRQQLMVLAGALIGFAVLGLAVAVTLSRTVARVKAPDNLPVTP